jgi:hypothetical protein
VRDRLQTLRESLVIAVARDPGLTMSAAVRLVIGRQEEGFMVVFEELGMREVLWKSY